MAIESFDLSRALGSQSYAFKCWENYYYGNNTMGIDAKSMGEIKQTYKSELANWQANALNDENAYEIPDDDFSKSYEDGKNTAKEDTGFDGKKGGMIARGAGDATLAATGAVGAQVTKSVVTKATEKGVQKVLTETVVKETAEKAGLAVSEKTSENLLTKAASKATENAAKKGTELTTQEASKAVGKSAGSIVGCVIGLATAVAYMAKKPNKDEKEACDKLQDTMATSQAATAAAQEDMAAAGEEVMALSDEAAEYNEEANNQIEEQKTEYDMYMRTYTALKEKAESGEALTEEEKALYTEIVGLLTESGELMVETQDETSDTVSTIYDDMGGYQERYDYAAETVAEVQGVTDYAESFDSATRTMCYVEGAAQTLNAASSAKSAYEAFALAASGSWAFGATAWAYAFGAMGAAGAVMSGIGAAEQFKWAGEVGTEIEARKVTQDLNAATNDVYETEVDNYGGWMSNVEDLELQMPDEMEVPEDTALPENSAGSKEESTPIATGFGISAQKEETEGAEKKEEKPEPDTGIA